MSPCITKAKVRGIGVADIASTWGVLKIIVGDSPLSLPPSPPSIISAVSWLTLLSRTCDIVAVNAFRLLYLNLKATLETPSLHQKICTIFFGNQISTCFDAINEDRICPHQMHQTRPHFLHPVGFRYFGAQQIKVGKISHARWVSVMYTIYNGWCHMTHIENLYIGWLHNIPYVEHQNIFWTLFWNLQGFEKNPGPEKPIKCINWFHV